MRGLLIEGAVYALLILTPLAFGGVELWALGLVQIVSGAAFALWAWGAWVQGRQVPSGPEGDARARDTIRRPRLLIWISLGLFVLLTVFQLLPLPIPALRALSPATHRLYEQTVPGYSEGKAFDAAILPSWLVERAGPLLPPPSEPAAGQAGQTTAPRAPEAPAIPPEFEPGRAAGRTLSIAPQQTTIALTMILVYAALFATVSGHFRTRARLGRLLAVAVFSGFIVSLLGIVQKLSWNGKLYWVREGEFLDPFGPFVNRNSYAAFAGMILPLALCLALSAMRRAFSGDREAFPRLFYYGFASVTIGGGIFYSLSRGGMIAAGAAILITAALLWRTGRNPAELILVVVLLAAAVVLLIWIGPEQVVERVGTLSEGQKTPSMALRLTAWDRASGLIRDHILVGTGLGTFRFSFLRYAPPGQAWWTTAHNEYIEILCDTGVAGGLIVLVGLAAFAAGAFHPASFFERSGRYPYAGLVAGISALLLHSAISSNMQVPANGVALVVLGAAVLALVDDHGVRSGSPRQKTSARASGEGDPR